MKQSRGGRERMREALVGQIGTTGYVYLLGLMEACELLVRSEKYTGGLWFRVREKIRKKL